MKNMLSITVITLIIIAFFTCPEFNKDYSNKSFIAEANLKSIPERKEEYIIEDYSPPYVETDCQDCLNFAISDCSEIDASCLELSDCVDWLVCVGLCEADNSNSGCYKECDDVYVDSAALSVSLKSCACNSCSSECHDLCGE